jgi:membrane protease YdiL (CAAX protease family)
MPAIRASLAIFVAALAANILVGSAFAAVLPQQFALILTQIFAIGGLAFVFNKAQQQPQIEATPTPWMVFPIFIACLFAVAIMANLLMAMIAELVPALQTTKVAYEQMVRELLRSGDLVLDVAAAVAVAFAAPIFEEYLFRGAMLQAQLRSKLSLPVILTFNGFLFSAMHLNPLSFFPLWIVGSLLAWSYVRTRNLWVPIIGHSAMNTLNGVVLPFFVWTDEPPPTPEFAELALAFSVVTVIVLALITLANQTFPRRHHV